MKDEDKFVHLTASKAIKLRHQGLKLEISQQIEANEKFLGVPLYSEAEKIKLYT